MNDMQPIRRKGSLLERADAHFDLGGMLRRAPDGAPPVIGAPMPVGIAPVPPLAPVAATPMPPAPPAPVATPTPVARTRPAAPQRPTGSAVQPIDRRLLADGAMIDPDANASAMGEEFRLIKRQILRNAPGLALGSRVLVTSSQPDEGKTFTALNLALTLAAERDKSVLLIDGDFARGDVVRRLGLTSGKGLMDLLQDPSLDVADCIIETDLPGLSVLPAGRATARDTEHLASERMGALLAQLEADVPERILLFDSTPLLAASSAAVLASLAGQVLVVVRAEVTREAALRDAIGLIGQHPAISLLLNRVRFTPEGRRFGSYYGEGG